MMNVFLMYTLAVHRMQHVIKPTTAFTVDGYCGWCVFFLLSLVSHRFYQWNMVVSIHSMTFYSEFCFLFSLFNFLLCPIDFMFFCCCCFESFCMNMRLNNGYVKTITRIEHLLELTDFLNICNIYWGNRWINGQQTSFFLVFVCCFELWIPLERDFSSDYLSILAFEISNFFLNIIQIRFDFHYCTSFTILSLSWIKLRNSFKIDWVK